MAKEARCPYCLDALIGEDPVVRCVLCRTPHHEACFNENQGCVAFGCGSVVAGAAGQSVLLRRAPLELGQPWKEAALQPLEGAVARYRPAKRLETEVVGRSPPHASIRFSVERSGLYPGQDLKARVVVAVPELTAVKRLEVHVYEEPRGGSVLPRRLFRATILGRPPMSLTRILRSVGSLARRSPKLEAGLHPYDIEIPGFYGRVILAGTTVQATVGIVLERKDRPTLYSPHVEIEPAWATAFGNPGQAIIARGPVRDPARPEPEPRRAPTIVDDVRREPPPRPAQPAVATPPGLVPPREPRNPVFEDSEFSDAPSRLWAAEGARPIAETPRGSGDAGAIYRGGAWPQAAGSNLDPLREVGRADRGAPKATPPPPRAEDTDALIVAPRPEPSEPVLPPSPGPGPSPDEDPAAGRRIVVRRRDGERLPLEPLEQRSDEPRGGGAAALTPSGRAPSAASPTPSGRAPSAASPTPSGRSASAPVRAVFAQGSATGAPTSRSADVRFESRRELPPLRLSLEVTATPSAATPGEAIELLVDAPSPLRSLELGCRYELSAEAPGEGASDAVVGKFPRVEGAVLVGPGALSPERSGRDEAIRVRVELDKGIVDEARRLADDARLRGAELVLRFAVDGTSWDGSLVGSGTRVVRFPLGKPVTEDMEEAIEQAL